MTIRLCRDDEGGDILAIINAAAEAYRGAIPADRWHEPYMGGDELDRERAAGVVFWGYEDRGRLAGVMGLLLGRAVGAALVVAMLAGVVVGMAVIARKGASAGRKTAIPFGPFLAIGGLSAIFSTHPSLEKRIEQLAKIQAQLGEVVEDLVDRSLAGQAPGGGDRLFGQPQSDAGHQAGNRPPTQPDSSNA